MIGCVNSPTEFTEFTEVWLRKSSHGIHRSFVASHSSINLESVLWEGLLCQKVLCVLCVLWEVFLCQKVPCVLCVLWEYSLPRISQINTDGWLRKSSHEIHRIHRSLGGCWLRGYGRMPYPPTSVRIRAHLWEVLLSQKVLCVPCVLWEPLLCYKSVHLWEPSLSL